MIKKRNIESFFFVLVHYLNLPLSVLYTNFKFFEKSFKKFRVLDPGELSHFLRLHPTLEDHFSKKARRKDTKFSIIKKKSIFQGTGSRRITLFPIHCTPLLKTIFQKDIL